MFFLKDPDSSELGKRIVEHSILLIDEIGFEGFTFKKLGERIGSNESSIYRYFENKHKLLVYLTSWYWGWLEYQLVFATNSIADPQEKLKQAIAIVTKTTVEDHSYRHINEVLLNKIVVNESSKSFLTKEVDEREQTRLFWYLQAYGQSFGRNDQKCGPTLCLSFKSGQYHFGKYTTSTFFDGSLSYFNQLYRENPTG